MSDDEAKAAPSIALLIVYRAYVIVAINVTMQMLLRRDEIVRVRPS